MKTSAPGRNIFHALITVVATDSTAAPSAEELLVESPFLALSPTSAAQFCLLEKSWLPLLLCGLLKDRLKFPLCGILALPAMSLTDLLLGHIRLHP